jgi:phosphate transport system protein
MAREVFAYKLQEIQADILDVGSMVEKALHQAIDALKRRDHNLSKFVIKDDHKINERRLEVEEHTLTLIATQQPVVAHDLRFAASAIVIVGELERMGDHAKGIARISDLIEDVPIAPPLLTDILAMAKVGGVMLHDALSAFVKQDPAMARQVATQDARLDQIYDNVNQALLQQMLNDRTQLNTCTHLQWVTHNLERIGDRVTNICERVVFIATGELPALGHQIINGDAVDKVPGVNPNLAP